MEKIVIQKGKEVPLIKDLEKIAKKNNLVQQIKLTPQPTKNGEKIAKKQKIIITLSGDYINTLKYLNELEKSKYYILVHGMNVTTGDNSSSKAVSSGTVKTILEGYVYFSI